MGWRRSHPKTPVAEGEPSRQSRDGETTGGFHNGGSGGQDDFVVNPRQTLAMISLISNERIFFHHVVRMVGFFCLAQSAHA
mgnify:CR=1 FL=1